MLSMRQNWPFVTILFLNLVLVIVDRKEDQLAPVQGNNLFIEKTTQKEE